MTSAQVSDGQDSATHIPMNSSVMFVQPSTNIGSSVYLPPGSETVVISTQDMQTTP